MATDRVPSDGPRFTFADGEVSWLSAVPCCRQLLLSARPTGVTADRRGGVLTRVARVAQSES